MALKRNFFIDQGSVFSVTFSVTDTNTAVLNLSTFSVRGQMRRHFSSNTGVSFTCSITDANTGTITFGLDAQQTKNLDSHIYVYDIEIYSSNTNVIRVLEGRITVTPEVTKT